MKKGVFFLILTLIFSGPMCFAQEEEPEIPEGMEVIQDGRLKVMAPIGAKKRVEENITYVEPDDAFFSRKVLEMQRQLREIEEKNKQLEQELDRLRGSLEEMRGSSCEACAEGTD